MSDALPAFESAAQQASLPSSEPPAAEPDASAVVAAPVAAERVVPELVSLAGPQASPGVEDDSLARVARPQPGGQELQEQSACLQGSAWSPLERPVSLDLRRQTADGFVPLPAAAATAYSSEECAAPALLQLRSAAPCE